MPDEKQQSEFDYSLVMSDAEIEHQRRIAKNLVGHAKSYLNSLDQMSLKKKRYENRRRDGVKL